MSEEEKTNRTSSVMADRTEEPATESHPPVNGEMANDGVNNGNKSNSGNVSDYDSTETCSDRDDRDNGSISGSESEGSVIYEREEGDGQESTPAKKVDDDEDKKNPQYIPKRGTFYEHDDRTADDMESPEIDKNDKESKKKVWQDKKEKWSHDRFNDMEQTPKSRAELVAIYGYDIRNEDGPPRARRRRRYGRGPNKYTRNWEDGEAYGKPTVIRKPTKKHRSRSEDDGDNEETSTQRNTETIEKSEIILKENTGQERDQRIPAESNEENRTNTNPPSVPHQQQQKQQQQHHQQQQHQQREILPKQNISNYHNEKQQQPIKNNNRVGTGRVTKPKREITDSDYRGFTKSRQFKSSPNTRTHGRNTSHNASNQNNKTMHELEKDMGKMNMQEGPNYKSNIKHNNQRQGSMPPRLQAEQKGSKRYSSIRQRSLPETTNPPFPQHTNYYANEFNQQNQTPQPQPPLIANNSLHLTTAQLPQIPTQTLAPIPTQVPVTTTPILQAPPQFAPPFPPAPPFLQPGVPPTTFIAPQPTPILNYVQGQPQYPQFQEFQQPFNAVNPPPELYQPQGGITYYSTQEQQVTQRAALLRRPKAAIPIVAPPEHRGRGRSSHSELSVNNDTYGIPVENLENTAKYEDASEIAAQ